MSDNVCELVEIDGQLVENTRPATPQEQAEIDARRTAPPAVPSTVTRRQAKAALLLAGKLSAVQPAINAIFDPTQRALMQIEWDESTSFDRHRPSLIQMAYAIGMTDSDIDALFIMAAGL